MDIPRPSQARARRQRRLFLGGVFGLGIAGITLTLARLKPAAPTVERTRNGLVPGRVARIDPSLQNGTVTVEITLAGALPKGARPDLSVDGIIELERLDNVTFVGRPTFGYEGGTIGIFKLQLDDRHAVRTPVQLGRSSVHAIEILRGLEPGDRVILSDMSQWDANDRIRLN